MASGMLRIKEGDLVSIDNANGKFNLRPSMLGQFIVRGRHTQDDSDLRCDLAVSLEVMETRYPFAPDRRMPPDKRFVYLLKNAGQRPRFYVGLTSDVRGRLEGHNAGRCPHTTRDRPWQLHVVIEFTDEERAIRFERYLKSGSGREFAKRHFEQSP
jgi:predicted GIY-YIG superfamily endonuclease